MTAQQSTDETVETAEDVVELLVGQHTLIRELFVEVEQSSGERRREAFQRLAQLLAIHETAEEQMVHPLTRQALPGGEAIAGDRVSEENTMKDLLGRFEDLRVDDPDVVPSLRQLREMVLQHAHHEEYYEFRYLYQYYDPARLRSLAATIRSAERSGPMLPRQRAQEPGEMTLGPVLVYFDRARDTLRQAMSSGR